MNLNKGLKQNFDVDVYVRKGIHLLKIKLNFIECLSNEAMQVIYFIVLFIELAYMNCMGTFINSILLKNSLDFFNN